MDLNDEFLTIIPPKKRIMIAFFSSLFLVFVGMLTLAFYFNKVDDHARSIKNTQASNYITSLYLEAEAASHDLQSLSDYRCTYENLSKLRHIVAVRPHIRSINIYRNGMAGCSSLDGYITEYEIPINVHDTFFYTTKRKENGYMFYMVYFFSRGYVVGVAINGYFVREALRYISSEAVFYPLQDFIALKPKGYAWKNARFPFVIVSMEKGNILSHISDFRLILICVFGVSLFIGIMVYISLGILNSPYHALKHYLRYNKIYPLYQPIVDIKKDCVVGLEVLMRCSSLKGSELSPAQFIAPAEKYGLLKAMTLSMLEKVQADFHFFCNINLYISLNITPGMIECHDSFGKLIDFSNHAQAKNIKVLIEITERESFNLTMLFTERLTLLRNSGILIAIDDFGTGYSNISSITKLDPDYLKIDKDFTSYSLGSGIKKILLESIIQISNKTKTPAIAEGIEVKEQCLYFQRKGIWLFQGYMFSRPCDAIKASKFIRSFKKDNFI